MSDIFREVDEALQQDKMLAIWKEYSSTIIAAIAILILSTALTTAYKNWDNKRDATETAKLINARSSDDPQTAIMDAVKDTRKGHKALGLMSAANLKLKAGKKAEAAKIYKQIATNKKSPRNLRDLARIYYIQNTDEKPDIAMLKPLLSNDKSPWIWHARVEAAVITAHDKENYGQALKYLENFKDAKYIPATLKQRAIALEHVYNIKKKAQEAK